MRGAASGDGRATGEGGVFVLGLQRSGTTWVANMLSGSGAVAAVAADDHRGVHESVFFSHFARAFGPLTDPAACARFREAFLHSDYYVLTGLDTAFLDDAIASATDHADLFDAVMRRVACDQDCALWLEKSPHHARLAGELAARLPAARFVCVVRDSRTLITSRLAAYGRTPATGMTRLLDILRGTLANALASRRLRNFAAGRDRALLLTYDGLIADPEARRADLAAFLGLPVGADALVSAYSRNTSHDRGAATRTLTAADRAVIELGDALGRILPLGLLAHVEERRRARRGVDWPDWVWKRSGRPPPGD